MVRRYVPTDYSDLERWWKDWHWDPIPQTMLPEVGFIVPDGAAAFLYKTDSPICWMEWLVSNKGLRFDERDKAVDDVVSACLTEALKLGAAAVFTSTVKMTLQHRLMKHGFKVGDTNVTQLIHKLGA